MNRSRILTCLSAIVLVLAAVDVDGKDGAIQCANLVYGGTHTSRCFSHEFLNSVQRETAVSTERRFKSVKLGSDELFQFPFVVMTGEKDFTLTTREREHLKRYLESGGFVLASAGCSSKEWDTAFRREIRRVFDSDSEDSTLKRLDKGHAIYSTYYRIDALTLSHPADSPYLEGINVNEKTVLIYSQHGLNDTAHTEGCCCCGGNEIKNAIQVNVNILVYALLH